MDIIMNHGRSDFAIPTETENDLGMHRRLVLRWTERYGTRSRVSEEDGLDREIWYERATRLFATVDLGFDVIDIEKFDYSCNLTKECIEIGAFEMGPIPSGTETSLASDWYTNPVFRAGARRELELCDAPDSDNHDRDAENLFARGAYLARERDRELTLKVIIETKYSPLIHVTLRQGSTPEEVRNAVIDRNENLGYLFAELEEEQSRLQREGAFLWSEFIQMNYEYRVLVVGGKPVTGTGIVPFYDGAWSLNKGWDDRMLRNLRNDREVESRPDLASAYRIYANGIVRQATDHEPTMRNYCLDLATGADGEILVVELKPLRRCETFATDARTLVRATIRESQFLAASRFEREHNRTENQERGNVERVHS